MRHLSRALRLVAVGVLLAGVAGVAEAPAAGADPGPLQVLAPTGPFHVGTVSRRAARSLAGCPDDDPALLPRRGRAPARPLPTCRRRHADLAAQQLQLPPQLLESIVTGAFEAPEPTAGRRPIILFSPGLQELRSDDTALVEEAGEPRLHRCRHRPSVRVGDRGASRRPAHPQPIPGQQRPGDARPSSGRRPFRLASATSRRFCMPCRRSTPRDCCADVSTSERSACSASRSVAQPPQRQCATYRRSGPGSTSTAAFTASRCRCRLRVRSCSWHGTAAATPPTRAGPATGTPSRAFRRQIHLVGAGHGDFSDEASFLYQLDPADDRSHWLLRADRPRPCHRRHPARARRLLPEVLDRAERWHGSAR